MNMAVPIDLNLKTTTKLVVEGRVALTETTGSVNPVLLATMTTVFMTVTHITMAEADTMKIATMANSSIMTGAETIGDIVAIVIVDIIVVMKGGDEGVRDRIRRTMTTTLAMIVVRLIIIEGGEAEVQIGAVAGVAPRVVVPVRVVEAAEARPGEGEDEAPAQAVVDPAAEAPQGGAGPDFLSSKHRKR